MRLWLFVRDLGGQLLLAVRLGRQFLLIGCLVFVGVVLAVGMILAVLGVQVTLPPSFHAWSRLNGSLAGSNKWGLICLPG